MQCRILPVEFNISNNPALTNVLLSLRLYLTSTRDMEIYQSHKSFSTQVHVIPTR